MADVEPETREGLEQLLDKLRKDAVQRIEAEHPEQLPEVVYHYGSAANVENILRNRCIWATEGHFLNDTSELQYAGACIADFLGQHPWPRGDYFVNKLRSWKSRPHGLSFVASFSAEQDLLSQWRAYSDDGAGVALGFDLSVTAARSAPLAPGLSEPLVRPCIYNKHDEIMKLVVLPQLEAVQRFVDRTGYHPAAFDLLEIALLVTADLLGLVLKNAGFREEREWRIVAVSGSSPVPDAVSFRNTRFGPAPFISIPLVPSQLKNLVLGPRCDPAVERSFRIMLDRYGCTAKITHSAVSYR